MTVEDANRKIRALAEVDPCRTGEWDQRFGAHGELEMDTKGEVPDWVVLKVTRLPLRVAEVVEPPPQKQKKEKKKEKEQQGAWGFFHSLFRWQNVGFVSEI